MKIKKMLFVLALALGLVGCSEEEPLDGGFFEWTDQESIAPLSCDSETGLDWFSEYVDAKELLSQNGISFGSSFPTAGEPTAQAIVISDQQVIADIIERYGLESRISEVGADRYSIVVGSVIAAMSNYLVTAQRAKNIRGEMSLRLMVEQSSEYAGFCAPCHIYFAAIYAADLPSGPVNKIYVSY